MTWYNPFSWFGSAKEVQQTNTKTITNENQVIFLKKKANELWADIQAGNYPLLVEPHEDANQFTFTVKTVRTKSNQDIKGLMHNQSGAIVFEAVVHYKIETNQIGSNNPDRMKIVEFLPVPRIRHYKIGHYSDFRYEFLQILKKGAALQAA